MTPGPNNKKEKHSIGIRADGNTRLGMGHLMRCRTIADAIVLNGAAVVFYTADDTAGELISSWGFQVRVLNSDYCNMEAELPVLLQEIEKDNIEVLLVDSYQVTKAYFEVLGSVVPVVRMDDMGDEFYPVNGVINYNIYGGQIPYKDKYSEDVKLLLGSEFAPVRAEFLAKDYKVAPNVNRILITMGGSDQYNIAGGVAKELWQRFEDVELHVVCGAFSPHLEEMKALCEEKGRIRLHVNVKNMADLMANCDIAISAAGSTMYELCAVGVPAITCYYVDNQMQIAESFGRQTLVCNAGNYAKDAEKVLEKIISKVQDMICQVALREDISRSMKAIVDGYGADRIAKELVDLCG